MKDPSYPPSTWRLILHGEANGATNMALDEAILRAVVEGASPPTLRFYAWSPPCLSLGRSQPLADADLVACAEAGVDVVRRLTGGRAILHTDELTYSVNLLQDDPRATGDVVDSYRRLSEGLLAGLDNLDAGARQASRQKQPDGGPSPVCFETPSAYEIVIGERKLVGSAQWRSRGGVLQHGSLPLAGDLGRIVSVLNLTADEAAQHRRDVQARATTLEAAMGRCSSFGMVAQALTAGFEQALNVSLIPGDITGYEHSLAAELRRAYSAVS